MAKRHVIPLFMALISTSVAPALATGIQPAPTPLPPAVVTPQVMDWQGFYGGASIGYGFGTYGNDTNFPGDGEGDLSGATYGVFGGYYFQDGNWVYGPEIALTGTHMSGSESCVNPGFTCEVDVNYMATLRGNVGYLVGPDTLLFGTVGLVSANIDVFTDNGTVFGDDQFVTGYQLGVGAEYALSESMHLRGTLSHYIFPDADYVTDVTYTDVDMDATVFEIGLLFRF